MENLWNLSPFSVGCMEKSLSVIEWQHFEKKNCAKNRFSGKFFRKVLNFAGLWCPNWLIHTDPWGINRKMISISYIWYLFFQLCHGWSYNDHQKVDLFYHPSKYSFLSWVIKLSLIEQLPGKNSHSLGKTGQSSPSPPFPQAEQVLVKTLSPSTSATAKLAAAIVSKAATAISERWSQVETFTCNIFSPASERSNAIL